MWGQIGDKEACGAFAVTWHGKVKPSLLFSEKNNVRYSGQASEKYHQQFGQICY